MLVVEALKKWALRYLPQAVQQLRAEVLQLQASRQLSPEQTGCAAHAFKRANDGEGFDVQWEVWDNLRAAVGRPIPF